jgi:CHRD domain
MRSTRFYALLTAAMLIVLGAASYAVAENGGKKNLKSDRLSGFQETPALMSNGSGSFRAQIDRNPQTIAYELEWTGVTATAAHLHFAQRDVAGNIVVHLCGTGGKPACPAGGKLSGTITSGDVTAAQGLDTFAELLTAIRAGRIYVNVHSATFPGGEIRAQLNNANRK